MGENIPIFYSVFVFYRVAVGMPSDRLPQSLLTSHCEFDLISIRDAMTWAWRTNHIPKRLLLLPHRLLISYYSNIRLEGQLNQAVQFSHSDCGPMDCVAWQASLSFTNSQNLLKLMSINLVMPSNHLILCHPLPLLPSIFPSIRVFSNGSVPYVRWPKYWSFRFNISPSNKYSGLISFRIDWFDLLAVQGTLKNLLQHHSSKASIISCFLYVFSHKFRCICLFRLS